MARFLSDENLGQATVAALRSAGFEVTTASDAGLRGSSDDELFRYAVEHELSLITRDLDFSDIHRFALGSHHGIVICRFPSEMNPTSVGKAAARVLKDISDEELVGSVVVVSPGPVRIRGKG